MLLAAAACAHRPLAASDLDRVRRPAFISRIDEGAGPKARVFREDGSYSGKLKRLEPKEADRRLQVKLSKGMTRFEVSETLRATVFAGLPQEHPWNNVVEAAEVARELQSFLVEEVPANPPDYELLRPLGADAVVEFVIEDYGMRSTGGRAGTFIEGYGRMFTLAGRGELWRRSFRADQIDSGSPHVDPFRVGKEPAQFRLELTSLIDGVAAQFSKDLNPPGRSPRLAPEGAERAGPDDSNRTGKETPVKPPAKDDELPDPDPI
ncbi:MAG: hypothetical protein HYZ28_13665 [Myxococcales bacterium]|nr:hypothetical protein [Myxococcales bacterium]